MNFTEHNYEPLRALQAVGPRFFHIISHSIDGLYIGELQLEAQTESLQAQVANCKPGIWASSYRHASQLVGADSDGRDAIVRWVEDGELNLGEPDINWVSSQFKSIQSPSKT